MLAAELVAIHGTIAQGIPEDLFRRRLPLAQTNRQNPDIHRHP
jgi:hypothetical protein